MNMHPLETEVVQYLIRLFRITLVLELPPKAHFASVCDLLGTRRVPPALVALLSVALHSSK